MGSQITIVHNGIKIDKRDVLIVFNNMAEDNERKKGKKKERAQCNGAIVLHSNLYFSAANKFGKCVKLKGIQSEAEKILEKKGFEKKNYVKRNGYTNRKNKQHQQNHLNSR